MSALDHFEVLDDHACFRLTGSLSTQEAAHAIIEVIGHCRERDISRLFVDMRECVRSDSLSTIDYYDLAKHAAQAAGQRVRLALIPDRPISEMGRFSVTVARNSGFTAEVFASPDDALAWLRDPYAR